MPARRVRGCGSRHWANFGHLPPFTPLSRASSMRAVQTPALAHLAGEAAPACLGDGEAVSPLTPVCLVLVLSIVAFLLPAPLRSTGITPLPRYYGCSDSPPVSWPRRGLPDSRHNAFRPFCLQPHPMLTQASFTLSCLCLSIAASPLSRRLANMERRIEFVSYGPVVRFQLLSTPPHGDAVAFIYGASAKSSQWTCTS